jgi:hypothetical protein
MVEALSPASNVIHEFASSQDMIGWDNFAMGMVSAKLLPIQSAYLLQCNSTCPDNPLDLGDNHSTAAGDAFPVDLSMCPGPQSDHWDLDLGP